ncbi:MAG: VOC family protein, partial [Algicola sp.]|nr:VOC family protein [Algicola sp.]
TWYHKKLGFELVNRVDMPKRGFSQANLKRQGAFIELIETNKTLNPVELLAGTPKKTKIGGFFKLGFQVADFDLWLKWLTKAQVKLYGTVVKDPVSGKRTVLILDPDGNRIQLFER